VFFSAVVIYLEGFSGIGAGIKKQGVSEEIGY
jgi:hypothetical protein